MPNETLELSEHELYFLPPGTPATAPAMRVEVEIDGEMRAFLARLEFVETLQEHDCDQYLVFYRRLETRDQSVFAAPFTLMIGQTMKSEQQKEQWMRHSIAESAGNRYWHSRDLPYGVSLDSSGSGSVIWRRDGHHFFSEGFRWGNPWKRDEFESWPQQDFLQMCQQIHSDETSQLHGAIEWNSWSPERKDSVAFGCENGDWETLQQLFGCAQKVIVHHCGGFPHSKERSFWRMDDKFGESKKFGVAFAWAMRWQRVLCEILRPFFLPDPEDPAYVWWWRHEWSEQKTRNSVRCGVPTHHEFLEAQLELREFLRPHLSEDEIEALMRPSQI